MKIDPANLSLGRAHHIITSTIVPRPIALVSTIGEDGVFNVAPYSRFMLMSPVPMIVGIGIDDGVHIMHRWKHEGRGKIRNVYSSTGKAILLTSLTTMFAFGSLIFSAFPAFGQFGAALFLGVAACFLTSILILPGIIAVVERREKRKIQKKELKN